MIEPTQPVAPEGKPMPPAAGQVRRAGPSEAWLRRWPIALTLLIAGGAAGVGASTLHQTVYTAEARVAVGAGALSSGAIAGFPLAASQLASNYARYVNDQGVGGGSDVTIAASPIPDSNIIRIEGSSTSVDAATQQVQRSAESLVAQVNSARENDETLPNYVAASKAWSEAAESQEAAADELTRLRDDDASRARIASARAEVARLTSEADIALLKKQALGQLYTSSVTSSSDADLLVVNEAAIVNDDGQSTRQRFGLLGAVLGLGLSILVAVALERRQSRGRRAN